MIILELRFIGIRNINIITPRKINMESENTPLEKEIIFQTIIFRFYVNLRGCNHEPLVAGLFFCGTHSPVLSCFRINRPWICLTGGREYEVMVWYLETTTGWCFLRCFCESNLCKSQETTDFFRYSASRFLKETDIPYTQNSKHKSNGEPLIFRFSNRFNSEVCGFLVNFGVETRHFMAFPRYCTPIWNNL